jgi:hypothetical protein
MVISENPRIDLTYCLNVHPGERWADQKRAIERSSTRIRDLVAPGRRFGLGMRLAHQAAEDLSSAEARAEALEFFGRHQCYPFTINGFPYSLFHGGAVKEKVYLPDWQSERRRDYTCNLADILAVWLPEEGVGSISTVPGSYKPWINRTSEINAMVMNLAETVLHLHTLRERTGKEIHLGLEPEPDCYLETTEGCISFLTNHLFPEGVDLLRQRMGMGRGEAEAALRRHVGMCFDTCHLALQFEDLCESWERLQEEGIRISKVQLSNALEVPALPEEWQKLEAFAEPVYLHQVKARRTDGSVVGWPDLPAALPSLPRTADLERLRVHFHVPLFCEGAGDVGTTSHCLTPRFFQLLAGGACSHLEIETYTFDVLPEKVRPATLEESVAREYRWVLERLAPALSTAD